MPNWFAYIALLSWPLVAAIFYAKFSPAKATVWTILGAQYLLPSATIIKIPTVPQLDRSTIPSVCVFVAWLLLRRAASTARHFLGANLLIAAYALSPLITALLNSDAILIGGAHLPGVGIYDGISAAMLAAIGLFPLLVGRQLLGTPQALVEGLRALAWCGAFYSIPMLFEMKMSPLLHSWFYGFSPSDIIQQIRGEGFRPMVFMGHGLTTSFFSMLSFVAVAILARAGFRRAPVSGVLLTCLGGILVLSRSLGAIIYGAIAYPLVRWGSIRLLHKISLTLVTLALAFPLLRYTNAFPTEEVVSLFNQVSPDRANSLAVRFRNEDLLLDKASERWLFGWGRYGRSRIYSEESGRDISVTDGRWIIDFGQYGLFGFVAEFGLLAFCVWVAAKNVRFLRQQEQTLVAGAGLLLAINVIELVPNSTLTPWSMLLAGVLLGIAERGRRNRMVGSDEKAMSAETR